MTRESYTHITLILDRSGSMFSIRSDVVGGVNRFIDTQKGLPGECTLSLVQFDDEEPYEVLRDFASIATVPLLGDEYSPRGNTPLYDAIGKGIVKTGKRLAEMAEEDRPGRVIFCVMTDGLENASTKYTQERVRQMTEEQINRWKWEFVYLGANQDAIEEGAKIGTPTPTSANFMATPKSVHKALRTFSANAAAYRTGTATGMSFSPEQRQEMEQE